ncbi:cation/H(+) antiporter 18 [Physcomitrium patens]|uniref:Uncharacterized protein n=1 Tax=Physcomitrium patens TaxID=3218 RepID=A0A2K1KF15_PHYPA|nr:cation/H(+) antiporter 18-like [Physcomitrium patens]PNR52367.1 hypothetical protein PHYPA_008741 [Physcomitrium patens]|eukprot:XP_024377620.1 cation/H(+) antiporter 18-like [Physcomitrella patens]
MASENVTDVSVTSSGVVAGDNPLHHTLPLLIIQVMVIITVSRCVAVLLRPLKQPRVVAEILGGILLGPTAFGHIPGFTKNIFPESSLPVLETVAEVGLIFFLFLVGLELDTKQIRRSGVMTLWLSAAGIILPFGLGAVAAFIIFKLQNSLHHPNFGAFVLFLGVALSVTAFPVLARILTERKLLHTDIGQMAMAAAAINDVVAWVLLALAVAITSSGSDPLVALWVLLLGTVFIVFMLLVISPITYALAHHSEPATESVIAMTLMLVLGAAFITDLIGIHVIFGAFICGLIIPKDGPFTAILIEKVEDYVSVLFLPLYFAASGLKTHLSAINNGTAVLILFLVIASACVGKVLGTFIVAKVWGVGSRKAIALGFLMNTKGLVELIILNIGLSKGVLNEELFAIMVIMTITTTFITTPVVMWLYKPACDIPPYKRRTINSGDDRDELRMLFCLLGSWNINSMMKMAEITGGEDYKNFRAYVLHLVEYSERLSTIQMSKFSKRESEDGAGNEGNTELDAIEVAFQKSSQLTKVKVKTEVAISAFHNMHIDVCNAAYSNRVNFLLLPFHRRRRFDKNFETVASGLKEVNMKVFQDPPCSVGLLVDNGFGDHAATTPGSCQHILVLFFGGPDDRESLMLGRRMLKNDGVKLTVIQFVVQDPKRNHLCSIRRVSSRTLKSHLQTESAAKRGWSALKHVARDVVDFFAAPWVKTKECGRAKQNDLSPESSGKMDVTDATETQPDGETHVLVDDILLQKERDMNVQALAPILAAATAARKEFRNRPMNNASLETGQGPPTTAVEELQSEVSCRNLTLRVVETQNLKKSVLDTVKSAEPNGLIITGLHLHEHSTIKQSGDFIPVEDYGLGPLGNYLVSKHLHMHTSLLVVKQHISA